MNFISHAQNMEDVILWRALQYVENGFYIDVGAAWPDEHSVTKSFYDAGWNGINIEPNPEFIDQYKGVRKGDINLSVAISDISGDAEMFFIQNRGLSSLNQDIAEGHSKLGWEITPSTVKVRTLADICEEYCLGKEIHFLKVDIEGLEKKALKGNNWSKFRPWVVVVEATIPMSKTENYKDWEPILIDAQYIFAYADGLNRFYVSNEHSELLSAFKYPPNVFDEFKLITTEQAEAKAEQAEAKAEQAEAKAEQAEAKAEQAEAKAEQAEAKAEQAEAVKEHLQKTVQTLEQQAESRAAHEIRQAEQLMSALEKKAAAEAAKEHLQQMVETQGKLLVTEKSKLEQLVAETNEQQEQAHGHAQWLQNEWDAAKGKVDGLNYWSHHWWLESEKLNKELKTVYRSKSWIMTWPLRRLKLFSTWLFLLPVKLIFWVARLPKRIIRWGVVKLMSCIINRPKLVNKGLGLLGNHPKIKAKLRALALEKGMLQKPSKTERTIVTKEVSPAALEGKHSPPTIDIKSDLSSLAPQARQIYIALKQEIEKNRDKN